MVGEGDLRQIAVSEEIGASYFTQQRARQFVTLTRLWETSGSESVAMRAAELYLAILGLCH